MQPTKSADKIPQNDNTIAAGSYPNHPSSLLTGHVPAKINNQRGLLANPIVIRDLLQELGITSICHENRRFNRAVDVLAKEGRKRQVPQFLKKWIVPPLFVRKIIAADKEGTSFPNMDIDSNNNMMETRKTAFVRQHEVPVASNVCDICTTSIMCVCITSDLVDDPIGPSP